MHASVYAVLLTCLYGTSFAAPIDTSDLTGGVGGLPGAVQNIVPVGDLANLGQNGLPVGLGKGDVTSGSVDGLVGDVTKDLPVGGLDGLTGAAGSVTKAVPGVGKRDVTEGLLSTVNNLTKDLPVAVGGGDITHVIDDAPLVGGKRDNILGSLNHVTDKLPLLGEKKTDPTGIVEELPLVGGKVAGLDAGSALGQQRRDTVGGLTGTVGNLVKPVTDLTENLQHLSGGGAGALTQ